VSARDLEDWAVTDHPPGGSVAFARDLGDFVLGVRSIDAVGRIFTGSGRGGDLCCHDGWMQTCFQHSEHLLDVRLLRRTWGGAA